MTQEEKAKAYDEAIERAKIWKNKSGMPKDKQGILDDIFPELAESEDERIRKVLLNDFKNNCSEYYCEGVNRDMIIAWLEKQGEQKSFARYKVGDTIYYDSFGRLVSFVIANIIEDGTDNPMYEDKDGNSVFQNDIVEQKTSNKVEPKFHEGEWITNGDYTWKIVEVKPLDYILQSQDGNIVDDTISHVDEQFHFFTIEDAKDGDILISFCNQPFIYNGKFIENVVGGYCGFDVNGNFVVEKYIKESNWTCNENIKPATREQRDLLFKKMKEAGYEWNDEKKELKKISQSMISAEAKEAMYDKLEWSEEDEKVLHAIRNALNYEKPRNYLKSRDFEFIDILGWLKSLKDRVQPKQEWSEEDEAKLKSILFHIEDVENKDVIDWFKALKDRVQPQPQKEWSEEDEKIIEALISLCDEAQDNIPQLSALKNWLKSLRHQNRWKPSAFHLECIEDAISLYEKHGINAIGLKEILDELKKLREE